MRHLTHLFASLLLATAVMGCATDEPTDGDPLDMGDDGDGGGGGSGSSGGGGGGSGGGGGGGGGSCGDGTCSVSETQASCPSDCAAATVCGDGVCDGSETASSCPDDCETGPSACSSSPDSCSGDNVCVAGTCEPAFGRVYKLYIYSGQMTQTDANGATWDSFGGLPDPYVNLFLNGTFVASTNYVSDTLTPLWNAPNTVTVAAGAQIQLDIKDDDFDVDGSMFSCFGVALTADVLRKHGGSHVNQCGSGGASVKFFFVPQ